MTGWIDTISNTINSTLEGTRTPATEIPPIYMMYETKVRPGVSAIAPTASTISRMGEANIETGALADGSQPSITALVRIILEELVKEIQLNGIIEAVIDPGMISVAGTSTTVPPVPFTATNILPVSAKGILR